MSARGAATAGAAAGGSGAPAGRAEAGGRPARAEAGDRPPGTGLRFAMLTTFYPPYSFGGDAIGVQRLSRALAARGHRVAVIHDVDAFRALHSGPEPREESPEPPGVEVHRLRSGFGTLSPLLTQQTGRPVVQGGRIRRILAEGGFDVVHFHNISLVGGPGVLRLGDGVKVYEAHEHWLVCPTHVLWRHGREPCPERQCLRCVLRHRRPPQAWRYTGYLERELRHVDLFIAKSEFSRRKHHEFGFPRDMEVLPYFLPDEAAPAEASGGPADPPHPRPYFLFAGRLERIKGLDDVIPAFRNYAEADLVVAGEGTHGEALRSLAAGNPRVRFLGRVDPEELGRYYRHAIALLVPSICFETFGIILIEAFRQGTPVIARDIGPFPEIVRACGGGELFATPDDLVAAMRRVQGDPAYRGKLAANARAGFRERWTERVVVPRYLELVRRAAESAGRRGVAERLAETCAA